MTTISLPSTLPVLPPELSFSPNAVPFISLQKGEGLQEPTTKHCKTTSLSIGGCSFKITLVIIPNVYNPFNIRD